MLAFFYRKQKRPWMLEAGKHLHFQSNNSNIGLVGDDASMLAINPHKVAS